ncbi:helix-turn-helix domain-containing protein [Hirschia baltica]|uniref:Helix-turn-helix domain protein n=1 Tax=Hirschia baltica (strain ATCC 49814 / DSM 5838 / IFAM 1418) TaxID=582402 RepID=C6XIC2_HIRBI|nr:helix-turn-helix transcriptional regulator [Hirschia baltica]ACT58948.1 helix-turn-helix domain protein [Hirschia baltica ATCC 49814]
MDMRDRIRQRLKELGKTQAAASIEAGLGPIYLPDLFKKTTTPSSDRLVKLAPVLQTSVEWLVTGEGDKSVLRQEKSFFDLVDLWRSLSTVEQAALLKHIEIWSGLKPSLRSELNKYVEFLQSKR